MKPDSPISSHTEDALHRAPFAHAIAADVARYDSESSIVVALLGPWGSGKTSLLNMVVERLMEEAPGRYIVTHFNPWLFSGTDQLVTYFLYEIATELAQSSDRRYRRLANRFKNYADVLNPLHGLPIIGKWISASNAFARFLNRDGTPNALRNYIESMLAEGNKRLLIVIDDIDRLQPIEVRHVVQMVRLVASFSNTTYLLAFDRPYVERALSEGDERSGRDYLEKIVQVSHTVPAIGRSALHALITSELDGVVDHVGTVGPLDQREWSNTFVAMRELFRSIRDVRQYVNSIGPTLKAIGEEVALSDVLAFEALRVLEPGVFQGLPAIAGELTYTAGGVFGGEDTRRDQARIRVSSVLGLAVRSEDAVRELILILFPSARRLFENTSYGSDWLRSWRRERRVAHPDVLRTYLELALGEGQLSAALVETLYVSLTEPDRLDGLFAALTPDELEQALGRLEDYESEFPDSAEGAVTAILNQLNRLREG